MLCSCPGARPLTRLQYVITVPHWCPQWAVGRSSVITLRFLFYPCSTDREGAEGQNVMAAVGFDRNKLLY